MTPSEPVRELFGPPARRLGPLFHPRAVRDTKDPCPVYDGHSWHLFGSAGSVLTETWRLGHATARTPGGPWTEHPPLTLVGVESDRVAAPGVVHDGHVFHMFVQTDFLSLGGTIEHLISSDGRRFERVDTALSGVPGTREAGLFDAHPAIVDGRLWLLYAAMSDDLQGLRWDWETYGATVRGPDVFAAVSSSGDWAGPWERCGRVLAQEDVPLHVRPGSPDYEWGLEGPQILPLEDGLVLLTAVCFVSGRRGARQRVFLATGRSPVGPFDVLGLALPPGGSDWQSGEVGHATAVRDADDLWIFFQARSAVPAPQDAGEARWRFGAASWPMRSVMAAVHEGNGR